LLSETNIADLLIIAAGYIAAKGTNTTDRI
jgi:hypothetical protein